LDKGHKNIVQNSRKFPKSKLGFGVIKNSIWGILKKCPKWERSDPKGFRRSDATLKEKARHTASLVGPHHAITAASISTIITSPHSPPMPASPQLILPHFHYASAAGMASSAKWSHESHAFSFGWRPLTLHRFRLPFRLTAPLGIHFLCGFRFPHITASSRVLIEEKLYISIH
jgi:hypothetical protein